MWLWSRGILYWLEFELMKVAKRSWNGHLKKLQNMEIVLLLSMFVLLLVSSSSSPSPSCFVLMKFLFTRFWLMDVVFELWLIDRALKSKSSLDRYLELYSEFCSTKKVSLVLFSRISSRKHKILLAMCKCNREYLVFENRLSSKEKFWREIQF